MPTPQPLCLPVSYNISFIILPLQTSVDLAIYRRRTFVLLKAFSYFCHGPISWSVSTRGGTPEDVLEKTIQDANTLNRLLKGIGRQRFTPTPNNERVAKDPVSEAVQMNQGAADCRQVKSELSIARAMIHRLEVARNAIDIELAACKDKVRGVSASGCDNNETYIYNEDW